MNRNGEGQLTIPSRSIGVWRRLYTRYSLEPYPASVAPDVAKTIQPVTNADDLLWRPEIKTDTVEVSVSTIVVATVPTGERWTWYAFAGNVVGGDRDIDRVIVGDGSNSMVLSEFTAVADRQELWPEPFTMLEGWTIQVRGAGGTTNGDWGFGNYIRIEDVF